MPDTLSLSDLSQFTGTENYYKHLFGIVYTDGVKYLADAANCYWLIDAIASHQLNSKVRREEMQFWTLEVKGNKAELYLRHDTNTPKIVRQKIEYTDFPFQGKFDHLWLELGSIDGIHPAKVLMLKSER